jgi:hypothetical protein
MRFCIQYFSNGKISQPVQNWCCNMRGQSKAWPTPSDLGSSLATFLLEFSFASARQMSNHFHTSHYTIKDILGYQLGLRKFSRRRVRYRISDNQKATRTRNLRALLAILLRLQDNSFDRISTGDESQFLYEY